MACVDEEFLQVIFQTQMADEDLFVPIVRPSLCFLFDLAGWMNGCMCTMVFFDGPYLILMFNINNNELTILIRNYLLPFICATNTCIGDLGPVISSIIHHNWTHFFLSLCESN